MYHNPYMNLQGGRWIKTNFHTHAGTGEGTCGSYPIDFVLQLYRELGYGAVCLSNHDLCTDAASIDGGGLFVIQGVEYSRDEHMLTVGVNRALHELPHQEAIDEAISQNGFVIPCHPNWIRKEYWPRPKLDALSGYTGIEVINMLIYRLSGSGLATDTWDYILKQGRLIYGFGSDDFHRPYDAGRGYTDIYVLCDDGIDSGASFGDGAGSGGGTDSGSGAGFGGGASNAGGVSFAALKRAVDCGRFTASTGLSLEYFTLTDGVLNIKASYPRETYINEFNYRFISENGLEAESFGETAEFKIKGEKYIRVEACAENGALLFTQPVYEKEFFNM